MRRTPRTVAMHRGRCETRRQEDGGDRGVKQTSTTISHSSVPAVLLCDTARAVPLIHYLMVLCTNWFKCHLSIPALDINYHTWCWLLTHRHQLQTSTLYKDTIHILHLQSTRAQVLVRHQLLSGGFVVDHGSPLILPETLYCDQK